jgi:hypothetical protein
MEDPDLMVRCVVGSAALEGAEFSPEFVAELRRIATGEITADSVVERIIGSERRRQLAIRYPTMYRRVDFDDFSDESELRRVEFIPAPEDDDANAW